MFSYSSSNTVFWRLWHFEKKINFYPILRFSEFSILILLCPPFGNYQGSSFQHDTRQDQIVTSWTSSVYLYSQRSVPLDLFPLRLSTSNVMQNQKHPSLGCLLWIHTIMQAIASFMQPNVLKQNMVVHRGWSVSSSLTNKKQFTSLSSLPAVGCPLVNLNSQSVSENHFLRLQWTPAHYL